MYNKPDGWVTPIRKTWAELKKLRPVMYPLKRPAARRFSVLQDIDVKPARPKRHITKGRTCSSDGLTNHERVLENKYATNHNGTPAANPGGGMAMKTALLAGAFCAVVWMIVAAICGGCARLVLTVGAVVLPGATIAVMFIMGAYAKDRGMRG